MSLSQNRSTEYSDEARLRLLSSVFGDKKDWTAIERTGNVVYDTVSLYCSYLDLPVANYHSIREAHGDSFTCADVARASHLVSRTVKLEGNWYKSTSVPFLAYYGENKHPVLCLSEGKNRVVAHDLTFNASFKITKHLSKRFGPEGMVFLRPFARGPLSFKDVLRYGANYVGRGDIVNMVFMTLLCTLVGLLLPVLHEQLFDKLIPMGSFTAILELGVVILSCSLGNILFRLVKNMSTYRIVSLPQYAIMDATLERLFHLPQSFIEKFGSSDLATRLFAFIQAMASVTTTAVSAGIGSLLSVIYLIRMFIRSKKLSWAVIIILAVNILVIVRFAFARGKHTEKMAEEKNKADNLLYSYISGIMKVRLSMMEDRVLYDYQLHNTRAAKNDLRQSELSNYASSLSILISSVMTIVIYYIFLKKDIGLSLGKFSGFMSTVGLFTASVMQLVDLFSMIPQLKPVVKRVMPIYEEPCEDYRDGTAMVKFEGNIEADHVFFAYSKDEPEVLKDICFRINKGEYIGIVGPTGCGKSTLLKLLLGFEKVTGGSIYFDGKDIDILDKLDLRRQMGVVLQDGRMVTGSIYENVALAAPLITEERAEELLCEAGMKEDLERMPMGVRTVVSEGGGTVSGGQQQRILIARALANDPAMLLFDEATSALDTVAQDILCDTLAKRNITRIVIAHRLATVKKCDRILVMEDGRITQQGTFAELSNTEGLFRRLAQEQKMTEVPETKETPEIPDQTAEAEKELENEEEILWQRH